MRKISNNINFLLAQEVVEPAYLLEIKGPAVDVKYTTAPFNLTTEYGTFISNSSIFSVDLPLIERASNREAFKIILADVDFEFRGLAELDLIGSNTTLYMVLKNNTNGVLGGAQPGNFLLNTDDIVIGFEGLVDTKSYAVNAFEGYAALTLECSTPMAALGMVRPYITSREYVTSRDPLDTAYDQVNSSVDGLTLQWGKE